MQSDSGKTRSVWMETSETMLEAPLAENTDADICIVGAGIAGMTAAYVLGKQGKRVVVLDDGPIGGGETGRTTAHLSNALDDRYFEIERLHGEKGIRLAAESHMLPYRSSKLLLQMRTLTATSRESTDICSCHQANN